MSIRRVFIVVSFLAALFVSLSAPLASTTAACDQDGTPGLC